jgi:hypothetical protein
MPMLRERAEATSIIGGCILRHLALDPIMSKSFVPGGIMSERGLYLRY